MMYNFLLNILQLDLTGGYKPQKKKTKQSNLFVSQQKWAIFFAGLDQLEDQLQSFTVSTYSGNLLNNVVS